MWYVGGIAIGVVLIIALIAVAMRGGINRTQPQRSATRSRRRRRK